MSSWSTPWNDEGERRYMHHYNAPGYTVGEVSRLGSPGRREIGHGYLAERALTAVLPSEAEFPYTIRSVTEIMSQNGSTSMAATCCSCSGADGRRRAAQGTGQRYRYGPDDGRRQAVHPERHRRCRRLCRRHGLQSHRYRKGITALQMDMKVHGLPVESSSKLWSRVKTAGPTSWSTC